MNPLAESWQFVLSGVVVGGIYALMAVGFSLVYQVTGILNLAQGEFAMIGAMASAYLAARGWPLPSAAAFSVALAAATGGLMERAAVRPSRRSGTLTLLFITLGLDIAVRGAALFIWGTNPLSLPAFTPGEAVHVLGGAMPVQAVWVLLADAVIVSGLYVFFRHTYQGSALRAAMGNPEIARTFGMRPGSFSFWSFVAAAAIGAVGGLVIAPITTATYDMGLGLGLNGFVAAILGGLDSLPGAVAGGFALGVLEKLSGGFLSPDWEQGIAFVLLLLVLLLRPQGLLGREGRQA